MKEKEEEHNITLSKKIQKDLINGEIKINTSYCISQSGDISFNNLFLKEDEIDWFREQLDKIR